MPNRHVVCRREEAVPSKDGIARSCIAITEFGGSESYFVVSDELLSVHDGQQVVMGHVDFDARTTNEPVVRVQLLAWEQRDGELWTGVTRYINEVERAPHVRGVPPRGSHNLVPV